MPGLEGSWVGVEDVVSPATQGRKMEVTAEREETASVEGKMKETCRRT